MPNNSEFQTLVDIMARLRGPDGCPWDKKQTHTSLREYLLDECYEALDALDEGSVTKLKEELGDILLQIVFHAQVAKEAGEFDIEDVARGINRKLIQRHPHIFGTTTVKDAEEVSLNWELIKRKEKGADVSILASVPRQMPSLAYAGEIQRRVAQVGFDWENIQGVIDKLVEEVEELRQADTPEKKEWEFGDLLFTLVNIGRRTGIDSEAALRKANNRFFNRFTAMEDICRKRGVNFHDLSFDEQNGLWDEVKKLGH